MATQSPTFDRMASGWAFCGVTEGRSLLSTKISPFGSVNWSVVWIGVLIAVMLYVLSGAVLGHRPSGRVGVVFSPSHGAPVCPLVENGGRCPLCGLSSGQVYRPVFGLNRMSGRSSGVGDS